MVQETPGQRRGSNSRFARRILHRSSSDVSSEQPMRLPDIVYSSILGVDKPIRKDPSKYNIGEVMLEPKVGFDPSLYQGVELQTLQQALSERAVQIGTPYIASGFVGFTEEGLAVLSTPTASINLGEIGSHAQRVFATQLAGRNIVLPVVIDEITDGEMKGRPGEQAVYLIPNPDRSTQRRLGRLMANGLLEGRVNSVDSDDKERLVIQTKPGTDWLPPKKTDVIIGTSVPNYDEGTDERPTHYEPVQLLDRVRVPVTFAGRKVLLDGNPTLLDFSPNHADSYNKKRQAITEGLDLFVSLIHEDSFQKITTPNGREFDVSSPEKKASVTRYLFAELRKQNILTPQQRNQLFEAVFGMDVSERPFIFGETDMNQPDPRRDMLDAYFRQTNFQTLVPIMLAEAMTPQQLLYEVTTIAALHDYPPPLGEMIGIIKDYRDQFEPDAIRLFLQNVLVTREEQLRTGSNPHAALYSLYEIMPLLQEQDPMYRTGWFAHLIHAGKRLVEGNQEWGNSVELQQLMRQFVKGLGASVFTDDEYYGINYDSLFTLLPYLDDHLRQWPETLPFELGKDETLLYILRDLETMRVGWNERDRLQISHVRDGLQRI